MKTIAIFRSNSEQPNENSYEVTPPGRWVAEILRSRLECIGINTGVLVEATEGWEFEAKHGAVDCLCYVNWVPIGTPPVDCWAVQTREKLGLLRPLFSSRRTADKGIASLLECIGTALAMPPGFLDIRWLDEQEFAAIY